MFGVVIMAKLQLAALKRARSAEELQRTSICMWMSSNFATQPLPKSCVRSQEVSPGSYLSSSDYFTAGRSITGQYHSSKYRHRDLL